MTNFFKHKMRGKSPGEIAGLIILGVIGIAALAILFGFVIMWLWNWLMPLIFGLPVLTYWQAVGIYILFKILLGGIGDGKSSSSSKHSKSPCKKDKKSDFSKWKHYDKFWKEEGDKAYKEYLDRLENDMPEPPENYNN
ncbi:hypothetical protein [Spongiimicrobium sp. 3-5]|uniref:hypothetical protein n=1 Tax=Spongiimicrobium sp. 3-5 TaxID=3332596 RepID=UPI003980B7B3